uniref:NADH-ubiquinone oxidoreductase chain 2 n=1 Tax=Ceraclea indistincta TaxID=2904887 RepID=A0A9E8RSK6_9NEOP|nr:NADH dehydrogenase subunit 2 [Ceraclea indistincta]UZZ43818.1 NADH dehydrogenase subunit 2 [Ceraclea indistincta]
MFNKLNNLKMTFMTMMILSTIFAISSSSWINIWISMEINAMSFIPIMMSINQMKSSESMMLYFLVQSISSMNLLFFVMMMNLNFDWMKIIINFMNNSMVINLTLLMKIGAAPFYFWFPKVIKMLSWNNIFILMTWQKIIPLMLMKYCLIKNLIIMSIIFSVVMSSIMAFNQTNLKTIMSFSSINHLGWMMTAMIMNFNTMLIYFINYMVLNYILCKMFHLLNIKVLLNMFMSNFNNNYKTILLINFLSLSGLPPFLGFFPKWLVIMNMMINNHYILMTILIMTALINLFFYLRILISTFMLSYNQLKWMINFKWNKILLNNLMILSYLSIIMMIIITIIKQFN